MTYLVFLISLILYAVLLIGIILIFEPSFKYLYSIITLKYRASLHRKKEPEIISTLSKLVFSSTGKENGGYFLLLAEILTFIFVFYAAKIFYTAFTSLIIALLAASVPILSLVSKTQKLRNRSSFEGPSFIAELYRQYRIRDKNIYTAMESVSQNEKEFPICSKQTYLLLIRLRASGNANVIEDACADFAFALGTSWGKTLSSCIKSACKGTDISDALIDMMNNLKTAKKEQEEKKRLNSESLKMTVFLVPVMYFSTMLLSVKYLGHDFGKMLQNQFCTPEGMLLFFLISFLFFSNLIILTLVNNDKLDI